MLLLRLSELAAGFSCLIRVHAAQFQNMGAVAGTTAYSATQYGWSPAVSARLTLALNNAMP